MAFPEFFARIPGVTLYDPLAELLGSAEQGLIEYHYEDAVRLAGHSCPTVAGAWLMTCAALKALYPDGPPRRGEIGVEFGETLSSGVTGVSPLSSPCSPALRAKGDSRDWVAAIADVACSASGCKAMDNSVFFASMVRLRCTVVFRPIPFRPTLA